MKDPAAELMKRYSMEEHVENGSFIERHYENTAPGRPASGSIYYYVAAGETTEFHCIDCDEYWCYAEGAPLEIWQFAPDSSLTVSLLGVGEGCEPAVYIPSGTVFASKHPSGSAGGTFLTCITVPRFSYDGFTLIPREQMLSQYPESSLFFAK